MFVVHHDVETSAPIRTAVMNEHDAFLVEVGLGEVRQRLRQIAARRHVATARGTYRVDKLIGGVVGIDGCQVSLLVRRP